MNVWLMKTIQSWGRLFLSDPVFVAIDQEGVDVDYGALSDTQRIALFSRLQQAGTASIQYRLVKKFFDNFYELMEPGDVVILGLGHRTQFHVAAILRITGPAQFDNSAPPAQPRHRRAAEALWKGAPFPVQEWGFARRLELLDSLQRYKELAQVLIKLV